MVVGQLCAAVNDYTSEALEFLWSLQVCYHSPPHQYVMELEGDRKQVPDDGNHLVPIAGLLQHSFEFQIGTSSLELGKSATEKRGCPLSGADRRR